MVNNVLTTIFENWYIIFGLIILVIAGFFYLLKELSVKRVKEWLKYAVSIAEKELGTGTGQLKLRKVYDEFISKYPWISLLISFEKFSELVDEALEWMKKQMDDNKKINEFVSN